MPKEIAEPKFMGLQIKCDAKHPTIIPIVESLYSMSFQSAKEFARPLGLHCRFRLAEGKQLNLISSRFVDFFKEEFDYMPLRVTSCEIDKSGLHYHMAVVIDGKKNTKYSLSRFFSSMKEKNLVADYKVIAPTEEKYGYDLSDEEQAKKYFKWMTYIAKTATKPNGRQSHSTDKKTQMDVQRWRIKGRPQLVSQDDSTQKKTLNEAIDLTEFFELDYFINPISQNQTGTPTLSHPGF